MSSGPGCCGPVSLETGVGQAAGADELPSEPIATDGQAAFSLSITRNDRCCDECTFAGAATAAAPIPTSYANACRSTGEYPRISPLPETQTGNSGNDGNSTAPELFAANIPEGRGGDRCGDACCTSNEVPDITCVSGRTDEPQQDGLQACCEDTGGFDAQKAAEISGDANSCVDRPAPCCDNSCLDRAAVRECQQSTSCNGKQLSAATGLSSTVAWLMTREYEDGQGFSGEGKGSSCDKHILSTKEKYASKIQALGCLCRALLALGQESCCTPRQRSSLERKRCSRRTSVAPRKSMDSRCDTSTSLQRPASSVHTKPKAPARASCAGGCCSSSTDAKARKPSMCCDGKPELCADVSTVGGIVDSKSRDVETSISGREHIVLTISGMTCTGCATILNRSLGSLAAVSNLKTSFQHAVAEFDLDLSSSTLEAVMKHLKRTTEFKCEQVNNRGGSSVDVIVEDSLDFIKTHDSWPVGVIGMTKVDQSTVNIAFDASVVGARDLVERGWGSSLHLAPSRPDPSLGASAKEVRRVGFMTILSSVLTIPVLVMAWAPLPERELAYGSASLALATLVQFLIAGPFYLKALKALVFSKMIEMDLLIVLSTTAAYVFSVVSFGYLVAGDLLSTGEFFETSTLLVTLIMVGRCAAALARQKAIESISIRSLQATTAILVDMTGDSADREIDARLLQYSDTFRVLPDCKVATDGTVISGSSEVDESMVTGESCPVEKHVKDHVIAGSINGSGTLVVRLTRLPGHNTISAIANMVDQVEQDKAKLQELADVVASYFVPVVLFLSVATFCIWVAVGVKVQGRSGSEAAVEAIMYAITVLIVSCPCAVGLAVPMVIVVASGLAAGQGVIIKDSESIETAYKTSHVVFDKTGTLTEGRLTVESEAYIQQVWDLSTTQSLLLALLSGNKHPVSAAVVAKLQAAGVEPASEVQDIKVLTGKGVEASTSSGLVLRAGNSRWLSSSSDAQTESSLARCLTTFCFTINDSLTAVFGLQDTLRPDAAPTVAALRARGITLHVLSGDDDAAVRALTTRLGIPAGHVRTRCTPRDKKSYIEALQQQQPKPQFPAAAAASKRPTTVLFCGDGTNDAVALAQADVGVHISGGGGGGTDVAQSAAGVVLMRPDLGGVLTLLDVSRASVRRIWFNFGWSAVYNVFAVLLGGGAFVAVRGGEGVRIPPAYAGLGELVSVVPVIVAAVSMRWV